MTDDFEQHLTDALVTRPVIEQAKGVLVGAHCAAPEKAYDELMRVSRAHDVELHDLAAAVVDVAAGGRPASPLLRKVVWQEWGDALSAC